ncbi:uncharacterized protein LOC143897893 isoform X1 [Temnothorax americanus]|uniref:uncharacterized protein LOC143897893 isoform X1 n=1 Tax=Temnothorax americanus TaxID=1964332 RepID=UPI0040690C48
MEEDKWRKIENKLSSKFIWNCVPAKREHIRKGRAKGEIITAVNKNLKLIEVREINDEVVEIRLEYNRNKWRIITLYSQKVEDTMETLREKVQKEDEEWVLVGGDFNAKTGSRGGPINEEEEKEKRSETKKEEQLILSLTTSREIIREHTMTILLIIKISYDKEIPQ